MAPKRQKGKPTIEQRLEAITQTLEIVAGMQLATEKNIEHLSQQLLQFSAFAKMVMTSHEARIKRIEKGGRG